jgi:hypothetical protein
LEKKMGRQQMLAPLAPQVQVQAPQVVQPGEPIQAHLM